MLRPLSSEARGRQGRPTSTKWTIKEALQGQGSCVQMTRSGHRRWERRDIKAEIDVHLFCHIEGSVPIIHHLLQRIAKSNPQQPWLVQNHHIKIKLASHPKNHIPQSSDHFQIIKSTGTERHKSKNRCSSLLHNRRTCSNNSSSTVVFRELNL